MATLALIILLCALIFGIWRKINMGVVSIGVSLLLAVIAGIPLKTIYQGFPIQLFITLLGTMLFFSILQVNNTLTTVSNYIVKKIGNQLFLLPIVMYILAFVLSAVGPGAIPVLPISILIAVNLAKNLGLSPILMGGLATLGSVGGTLSPIALTGIIVEGLLSELGLPGMQAELFTMGAIVNFLFAVILYLFYKGYSIKPNSNINYSEKITFTGEQIFSLLLLALLIIIVIGFKLDVGLVAFALSVILLTYSSKLEGQAIKGIPWSVIIMVCGVNVLMMLAKKLGAVTLLANILAGFMNESTAPAIMALTGGIMSQFSSANGVVIPTLVPTTADIANFIGGTTSVYELTFAITVAAVLTFSPLSTAGSLIMAAYSQGEDVTESDTNKVFLHLFIWTFVMLIIFAILCSLGFYQLYML
jgi:dicarboxylate carrier protein